MLLLLKIFIPLTLTIILTTETMGNLRSIGRIPNRSQSIIQFLQSQPHHVIEIQQIKDHLMKAHHRRLEIEWFVDIATTPQRVDELPLRQALIQPSIADRLHLHMPLRVILQTINHLQTIYRILKHVVTMTMLDMCTTIKDRPIVVT